MTQNAEEDKRQNSGKTVTVIERITGSFRDTTALMTDRVEVGRSRRGKAAGERRAGGKTKANLYPDAYHNRIDGMRRMIARRGWLPEDESKAFAEMLSNAMVRSRVLEGKESSPVILARWLRKEIPGARASVLADVAARACSAPQSYIPKEAIGRILKHTFEEAKAIGIAKTIYPFDIAPDEYEKFLENLRRARSNVNRRKVDRATYEGKSVAALARRHGVSRTTIYAWLKAGILGRETGQLNRCASVINKDSKRRGPVKQPPAFPPAELVSMARAVEIGLATGHAIPMPNRREALARLCEIAADAIRPARKAAPLPQQQEDKSSMQNDSRAESADATRPIAAPGDDRPDDANAPVRAIPADDETPPAVAIDVPRTGEHAIVTPADTAESARTATPLNIGPDEPEDDVGAEAETREREKAAYRAERAQDGQTPPRPMGGAFQDRGGRSAAPGRTRGTVYSALGRRAS